MEEKIVTLTGFDSDTLFYVWDVYCGDGTPISSVSLLLDVYEFIHCYPTHRRGVMGHFNRYYISRTVLPAIYYLGAVMEEINWNDRLDPYNHGEFFDKYVTCMVDTMPIFINKSCNSNIAMATYNGRYKENLFKVQVVIDFLGRIVFYSGPHIGSKYDGHLFTETDHLHPREDWEMVLGDGHYSSIPNFITPFKKPRNGNLFKFYKGLLIFLGSLNQQQKQFNKVLSHYRARVEHTNWEIQCHGMFRQIYRGSYEVLNSSLSIIINTINVKRKREIKYNKVGPWSHF